MVDMVECIMGNIFSAGFYPEDVDEVAMTGSGVKPQFLPGKCVVWMIIWYSAISSWGEMSTV